MASNRALVMLAPCIAQPARVIARQSPKAIASPSYLLNRQLATRQHHSLTSSTRSTRPQPQPTPLSRHQQHQQLRPLHRTTPLSDSVPSTPSTPPADPTRPSDRPTYELRFTCSPCGHRSSHYISKQGYHHGSVLISCPSCRNRHIISDHLKIFGDKAVTIEDILRDKGQLVKKGTLGEDEDVEFWEDGTTTARRGEMSEEERAREEERHARKNVHDGRAPGESFRSVRPEEGKE